MKPLKLDMLNEGDVIEFATIIESVNFATDRNDKPYAVIVAKTVDGVGVSMFMFNLDYQRETLGLDLKLLIDKSVSCTGVVNMLRGDRLTINLENIKEIKLSAMNTLMFEDNKEEYAEYKKFISDYTSDTILYTVKYISKDGIRIPYYVVAYDVLSNLGLFKSAGISEEEVVSFLLEYGRYFYAMGSIGDVRLPSINRDFLGGIESESETVIDTLMALVMSVEPSTTKGSILFDVFVTSVKSRLLIKSNVKDPRKGVILNNKLNL